MINTSNVIKTLKNDYVFFFILGLFFTQFSQLCGMLSGKEAVLYYAEIHQDFYNEMLHRITMPFAAYYFLTGVPPLIGLSYENSNKLRYYFYITLLTHYAVAINFQKTLIVFSVYAPVLFLSVNSHNHNGHTRNFAINNVAKASVIMVLVETIGHGLLEDIHSRPEGVINAILYSSYFAVNGISFN